jgi:predicted small integral membrane protein
LLGQPDAAGTLTIIPGAILICFVRNYIANGFFPGEGVMLSWMAWTLPTALVFIGIFSATGVLTVLEIRYFGGAERKGSFGLVTTRCDRLFITLLGCVYIFLAWLGLFGLPLWVPLGLALAWGTFCFWKV